MKTDLTNKNTNLIVAITGSLMFVWIWWALTNSYTPVDRDTLDYLIRYGRGDLNDGVKIFWRVHIGFGLYFKTFSYLTKDLMAPMICLTALSLVSIAVSGFMILKNYVTQKWALTGYIMLLIIPGYHFLGLLMEDNLPFLAAICWMACFLDCLARNQKPWIATLLGGLALAIALMTHIITIAFVFCPLLLLFSSALRRKWQSIVLFYITFIGFTALFLTLIPNGFQELMKAYQGDWGFSSQLGASNLHNKLDQIKREFPYLFRVMQATPANLSNLGSTFLKTIAYGLITITNIVYYSLFGFGLYRFAKARPVTWIILGMLVLGFAIPILTASFTAERLDVLVFFVCIASIIGFARMSKPQPWIKNGFALLIGLFLFWNSTLYAYYTRWAYKPAYYQKIIHLLENEKIEDGHHNGLVFLDENTLFKNIDYFTVMRNYPDMRHYGIEKEGKIYFIGEGWGAKRNYLSEEDMQRYFYSGNYINHATPAARERFKKFHNPDVEFRTIHFE